ncbi:hypothetical protein BOTBODRAFT_158608 [Botryobasidium botryosum FD-172 SS1]|uniref:Dynactin subunit 4 n=1 Tax=Botryobasidium botryosum (strain FD-172 SS1) TaxID=930990 RepID=A0A067MJT8_BOTB1|nr:hypothetical protein BOTBODRAFT_158608 [Botryobasidium botryosum FD-172 SS1]
MTLPSVLYHCTCSNAYSATNAPPPAHLPSSSYAFHPLSTLFFCEECDLVRCNRCVAVEVSGYYCPNCLFEVPSASVRAEKNRCARNCFQCPHCSNTLSVVGSDPPPNPNPRAPPNVNSSGDSPFFLFCNYCRWDSVEAGMTFEKPTGLAHQLQKNEDLAPETLEFDRLKDHFEPLLRASLHSSSSPAHPVTSTPMNAITAAANSALNRDIPGLRRKGRGEKHNLKDEWGVYRARIDSANSGVDAEGEVDFLRDCEDVNEIAGLEQRWGSSWAHSIKANDLEPLRVPLHSKQSKRCPECRHILIKPEQKSQSVRYKIKLMAANYLPLIEIMLAQPPAQMPTALQQRTAKGRPGAAQGAGAGASGNVTTVGAGADELGAGLLVSGRTYQFQLAFTNPLYDPIQVRLSVQRAQPTGFTLPTAGTGTSTKPARAPFAISLPTTPFPISAYAEAWEYDDDDEEMFMDDEELEDIIAGREVGAAGGMGALRGGRPGGAGGSEKGNVGVLERKANVTKVGGEVVLGKDALGEIKFNMLVSYTYRSDDPQSNADDGSSAANTNKTGTGEMKTFSFYSVVYLGTVGPRGATR